MASPGHAKPSIKQHGHLRLSNVSSPIWCQVIILTNDDFLFIGLLVAKLGQYRPYRSPTVPADQAVGASELSCAHLQVGSILTGATAVTTHRSE